MRTTYSLDFTAPDAAIANLSADSPSASHRYDRKAQNGGRQEVGIGVVPSCVAFWPIQLPHRIGPTNLGPRSEKRLGFGTRLDGVNVMVMGSLPIYFFNRH